MSVRSMARPSVRNCQASSRLVDESVTPTASADRSRTHWKNSCAFSLLMRRGILEYVVLRVSQSSVDTISRARRAFSRADCTAYAMLEGFDRSTARPVSTSPRVTRTSSPGVTDPMTPMSDRQAVSSSIHGSSSSSCRCTSRMRAVPSLRSMYRPIQNRLSAMRLSMTPPPSAAAVPAARRAGAGRSARGRACPARRR